MEKGVFLVTGGSRGLGEAIARDAARAGYLVAITYAERAEAAERVVSDIEAQGGRAVAIKADTGDAASVASMFEAVDRLGRLAVLCYNGGITGGVGPLVDQSDETLDAVIRVNLTGALWCCREAAKRMSTARGGIGGNIVLMSSRAAGIGAPNQHVWYAASKGGIDSLTTGLALELARDGIRVNAVSPGPIETEIHAPGHLDRISANLPSGRAGRPEEVSGAVMYLVGDGASYTSGANIHVSGAR